MSEPRECPICNAPLLGRTDKKFCSLKCKSISQYELRQEKQAFYLQVDRQLKINRKILKTYNHRGFTTLRKELLFTDGFDPNFFTHYWKNSKNDVYLFVYDYGFLDLKKSGKEKYLIVQWQDYMRK